jgi:purine-nucleoside phosphorylase
MVNHEDGMTGADVQRIARAIAGRGGEPPRALVVLGSGLGRVSNRVEASVEVPFESLPGMPSTSVVGHAGGFVLGFLGGLPVILQSGRFHAYEGHGSDVLGLTVRVAAELGVSMLVTTNAAGGVRDDLHPGDLVVLDDHLNLQGRNPLVGPVLTGEVRFPDMTEAYDSELRAMAEAEARRLGTPLKRGVYGAVLGPSFETPAEVRMLARLGVDVVGMSTVPEVITARARGLRCLAISMVTNPAAGRTKRPLTHDEVLEVGDRAGAELADVLVAVMGRIAATAQPGGAK